MKQRTFLLWFLISTATAFAQDIDRNDIKFDYIQLPAKHVDKSIKNYQCKAVLGYADDVSAQKSSHEEKLKQADADYQQAMKDYEVRKKEARERYDKQMVEWNKKKLAERILMDKEKPQ